MLFWGLGPDQLSDGRPRLVQQRLGALTEMMDARRVTEVLGERPRHRLDDRRVRWGGRVMVEVDAGHLEIWEFGNVEMCKSGRLATFPNFHISTCPNSIISP